MYMSSSHWGAGFLSRPQTKERKNHGENTKSKVTRLPGVFHISCLEGSTNNATETPSLDNIELHNVIALRQVCKGSKRKSLKATSNIHIYTCVYIYKYKHIYHIIYLYILLMHILLIHVICD